MNIHSLIPHLDSIYSDNRKKNPEPQPKDFLMWQKKKRKELFRLIGVEKLVISKIKKVNERKSGENIIALIDLYLSDGTVMPVYVARNKKIKPPFRPIIIYHGHADGAQTLFGSGMTKEHQDYALEFLQQGYLVIAPDQRGFGKRLGPSPIHFNGYTRSCRQVAFNLILNGKTILGERVSDGLVLVDYIRSRKDIQGNKIVVTGNSGGGTVALLHAALDARVAIAAVGSAFCEYKHSIMDLSHCECNYIPGLLEKFEEIWQIGALVAPRPLLIIHGKNDKIFPVEYAKKAYNQLKNYYRMAKAPKNALELHIHSGAHRYDHGRVVEFLENIYASKVSF